MGLFGPKKISLPEALHLLVHELRAQREDRRTDHTESILNELKKMASKIADHAAVQTAFNARMGTAIEGVAADIKALNELITQLQTTPGPLSPEDQATLDKLQTAGEALAARLESVDKMTPVAVAPVATPVAQPVVPPGRSPSVNKPVSP